MTDIGKTSSQQEQVCKQMYGEILQEIYLKNVILVLRIMMESLSANNAHGDIEKQIMQAIRSSNALGEDTALPVCVRQKAPVVGRFPWTTWPLGTYGLPMTKQGCPDGYQFEWNTGFYRQDTENYKNDNKATNGSNLLGNITKEYIQQGYCIKSSPEGNLSWPVGRYCIYKKGNCPVGMMSGEIFWDDEDNNNTNWRSGVLPDGMFKADTIVEYCCYTGSIKWEGIVLPRDKPFFLFPHGSKECQPVIGTEHHLEQIQWDLENDGDEVARFVAFKNAYPYAEITYKETHLILYYCFYNPIRSCGAPLSVKHVKYKASDYRVGCVLDYTCEKGYYNIGDHKDICLESEIWSSIRKASCHDINECFSGHNCHVKANCYNTEGSYYCKCNPGLTGDGINCEVTTCPPLPYIKHVTQMSGPPKRYLPPASVGLVCDVGYLLIGCNVTNCLSNGSWDKFPICVEPSYCIDETYNCMLYDPKPINYHQSEIRLPYLECTCLPFSENLNMSSTPEKVISNRQGSWVNTTITIVAALVGFVILMMAAIMILLKLQRRDRAEALRESTNSDGSIYADIKEFQLDLNMDTLKPSVFTDIRKQSQASTSTALTDINCATPPHVPPRSSVSESICPISKKSSLFVNPNRLQFRRRSDFGSTDLYLVPPKQFSTIFAGSKRQQNRQNDVRQNDVKQTQFKLNSLSQRRSSEFTMFPSYQVSANFVRPSLSILSNMTDSTTPIVESANEDENPYIDVHNDTLQSSDADSEIEATISDHYGKVPRNTLRISLRHRSRTVGDDLTGLETARQTYQKSLYRDIQRSYSLPGCSSQNEYYNYKEDLNKTEWEFLAARTPTVTTEGRDDVFVHNEEQKEKTTKPPKKRKSGVPRFSIKLKLTSITKQKKEENQEEKKERNISITDRFKSKTRSRAGTNPFF